MIHIKILLTICFTHAYDDDDMIYREMPLKIAYIMQNMREELIDGIKF